jgi:hypothetical protein
MEGEEDEQFDDVGEEIMEDFDDEAIDLVDSEEGPLKTDLSSSTSYKCSRAPMPEVKEKENAIGECICLAASGSHWYVCTACIFPYD